MGDVLERDPEDGEPRPKKWTVTFEMSRIVEIEADSSLEAEEKARDQALFGGTHPIDRDDIDEVTVGWVNPEPEADQSVVHLPGCWGNHCRHYACDTGDTAIDHREYCSQCDVEAY